MTKRGMESAITKSMNLEGSTINEAVSALSRLQSYFPFRYGGVWYVAVIGEQAVAYRSVRDLRKRAVKSGMDSLQYAKVG